LVRRFEAVPMLALEREAFLEVLRASLETLGKRFGFINANLRLVGVDDSAVDLLYEASRAVCAYSEEGLRRLGFGDGPAPGVRVCTPGQIAARQELFFDMRHVSRPFEQLPANRCASSPRSSTTAAGTAAASTRGGSRSSATRPAGGSCWST
jgi:hypothetical protein